MTLFNMIYLFGGGFLFGVMACAACAYLYFRNNE